MASGGDTNRGTAGERLSRRGFVGLLGAAAVAPWPPATARTPPDVIYHNGVVVTMEERQPQAEAVAIRAGRILAVGSDKRVLALKGRATRMVNLDGRTVLPGFIDSHAHWIGDGPIVGLSPEQAVDAALRRGWTTISEQFVDQRRLADLRARDAAGQLRIRVNANLPVNFGDEKFGMWFLDHEPRHRYSPHLRLAGIKLFLDHDWGTTFHWNQAELDGYVLAAHRNGWQVTAHTVSAEAHDQYLTAVARALAGHPDRDARHRVEHVIQLRDDQLARMRELRMVASIQAAIPGDSAAEAGFQALVARGRTGWIARWRDLVMGGVATVAGTDMPWLVLVLGDRAIDIPHGSPLEAVHQLVTRRSYLGRTPEDWQLAQRLTVRRALRLLTVDAAYGAFEEDVKGSLARGKDADLVIVSDNPLAVGVDSLPGIQVLATIVGGRVEHCVDKSLHDD